MAASPAPAVEMGESASREAIAATAPAGSEIPDWPQALALDLAPCLDRPGGVRLCQALGPIGEPCQPCLRAIEGVDCLDAHCGEAHWGMRRPIPWQAFAQGEYVGPPRWQHVPEYRLRVDDELELVYRLTREELHRPYQLNVGDRIRIESITDPAIDRAELVIQPDGSITLRLLGQVQAARKTVPELTAELETLYRQFYKVPSITVTPLEVNTRLEDLRAAVDSRYGAGGQTRRARVSPDGTVQLVAVGSIPAQGLTLDELKREIDLRYAEVVQGVEVTPVLIARAPRAVFVLGEVRQPGRYFMEGPTTAMQAIAMAGGWNPGANLRQIVVFRRAEDWRLLATKLDLQGALFGKRPTPADEIWLRDSDIVLAPKSPIQQVDDFVELYFTRGIYGVFPFSTSYQFGVGSRL